MESNKASKNGHKKRKYVRINTYKGPKGNFVDHPEGRTAKILIALIAETIIKPGETYDRNFRKAGLTKEWLYSELVRLAPWVIDFYSSTRPGWILTPHIVYSRWHKGCVYNTNSGPGNSYTVGTGKEHPRNNLRLQPFLESVDKLFKRNVATTLEEACNAGAEL